MPHDDDLTAQRLEYLLSLRKGVGISRPRDDLPRELFDLAPSEGWEALREFVRQSVLAVSKENRSAVWAALGEGDDAVTGLLKDRRADVAQLEGVSVRTVMRQEERGFAELASAITEKLSGENPFTLGFNLDLARMDIKRVLAGRLPDWVLAKLDEAVDDTVHEIHELLGLHDDEPKARSSDV